MFQMFPKVTETLVDLFKIDMETGKATAQGDAALAGAEFTWHYYDGLFIQKTIYQRKQHVPGLQRR